MVCRLALTGRTRVTPEVCAQRAAAADRRSDSAGAPSGPGSAGAERDAQLRGSGERPDLAVSPIARDSTMEVATDEVSQARLGWCQGQ